MSKTLWKTDVELIQQYQEHTGRIADVFDMNEVAQWLWENDKSALPAFDPVKELAKRLRKSARKELEQDPQERMRRKYHAARIRQRAEDGTVKQRTLWSTMDKATPEFMSLSAQQRRHQIIGDCFQLKTDVDSYNQNFGASTEPIGVDLNFTNDVAEREQPPTYEGLVIDGEEEDERL